MSPDEVNKSLKRIRDDLEWLPLEDVDGGAVYRSLDGIRDAVYALIEIVEELAQKESQS